MGKSGDFMVPLSTFWLPVMMEETIVDPKSKEAKKYLVFQKEPENEFRGIFLAPAL